MRSTRQLLIIHLSDLHFGPSHRFSQGSAIQGDPSPEEDSSGLLSCLCRDLVALRQPLSDGTSSVAICVTGDLTCNAEPDEFRQAADFLAGLAGQDVFGKPVGRNATFVVPGNHDVKYDKERSEERLAEYLNFRNEFFDERRRRNELSEIDALFDRREDLGAFILCVNTCTYVKKGSPEEKRGRVGIHQLERIRDLLEAVPDQELQGALRIALLHHHPILIPSLAEAGRGYDAVENSGRLLTMLRRFGFHVVLHGHKHRPHVFIDDSKDALVSEYRRPLVIVPGGSVASKEIADRNENTYNWIVIKYDPSAERTRVRVETRALDRHDLDGEDLLPSRWRWRTLDVFDRTFAPSTTERNLSASVARSYSPQNDRQDETERTGQYKALRGNVPMIEMRPSLEVTQAYEARVWIEPHPGRGDVDIPDEVQWMAGPRFPVVSIRRNGIKGQSFSTLFSYWGPVLIQAKLTFSDFSTAYGYVYAHLPSFAPEEGEDGQGRR